MTRVGESSSEPWETFWRSGGDAKAALGGESQQRALAVWWRDFFDRGPLNDGGRILDIASGAFPVFAHAAEQIRGAVTVSLDYSFSALKAGRAAAPAMLAVAGNAASPPLATSSFDIVCSQFGLEYAGLAAFRSAAALVARSGRLGAVVHYRGGAIDAECATNEAVLKSFARSGLFDAARSAFEASYAAPRAHQYRDKNAERTLAAALAAARRAVESAPECAARRVVSRYAPDVERMSDRRFAHSSNDALGWLSSVQRDLTLYRKRMSSMRAAALDEAGIRAAAEKIKREGLENAAFEAVSLVPGARPGAWTLIAQKP